MPAVLVAGSGQIGSAISHLLSQSHTGYKVLLADIAAQPPKQILLHDLLGYVSLDLQSQPLMIEVIRQYQIEAVVSCLPYFLNPAIAELAKSLKLPYFDLTEDIRTTEAIAELAKNAESAFVPQCGVAPGFINIVANAFMQHFSELDIVKLRCGALPQCTDNSLRYALTWSIDGLINQYGNPCAAIVNRQSVVLPPLSDVESVELDGAVYEAFNTSGGLGTLTQMYAGKVNHLNYKTLRYPGHWEKMQFLMNDLQLNTDRQNLKKILLTVLPYTQQDVVIVYVAVQGLQNGEMLQESYFKKFYPSMINGRRLSAIQMTTASSACAIIDLVLKNPQKYRGFIHQSQFNLNEVLDNHFGKYL